MTELIRHLFFPHHTNNFRARLLHLDFFVLYVFMFFLTSFSFRTVHQLDPNILGFATDIHINQLVSDTNQKRNEAGLGSLKFNALLTQAAEAKAHDMFAHNYWAHNSPTGTTPWDFINGAGYSYSIAGENLAKNFSDSEGVVDAWMNSPSHRENLLRPQYEDVGFAVVNGTLNGEETTLVVQMFGKQLATKSTPEVAQVLQPVLGQVVPAVSPVPKVATPAAIEEVPPTKTVEVAPMGAVIKQPLLDIPTLIKQLSLALSSILIVTLAFDAYYVWRHKIVRASGKHIAHLAFLFMVTGTIWFMSFGSII